MKKHITKVLAMMLAVLMLVSTVPAAALPEIDWTSAQSSTTGEEGFAADVELGKDGSTADVEADSQIGYVADDGKVYDVESADSAYRHRIVDSSYSPYEPYQTTDENHPFLTGGAAWIDLSKIYYGAPATPNYPITKWSANTSVYNVTGIDEYFGQTGNTNDTTTSDHAAYGKEIYSLPDLNLIDEYTWANNTATISGVEENGIATSGVTKTAANSTTSFAGIDTVVKKSAATAANAYVYNRYDAMQGKWGLTLDKNVSSVTWTPSWVGNYYGNKVPTNQTHSNLDNSMLYLTDTPYLYYSTEALDSTQIAISLLIGTPVQSEDITNYDKGTSTVINRGDYEFRWYTITDDEKRPGISDTTLNYSMSPNVYVSQPVAKDVPAANIASDALAKAILNGYTGFDADTSDSNPGYSYAANPNGLDPIALAAAQGYDTEKLYVDGSITGCIDFTQLLPLLMAEYKNDGRRAGGGSSDIKYKIAMIRVDTKTDTTVTNAIDVAARINYLYFGPGQSMIYTPQSTVGNTVNAANWMYGQLGDDIGDGNDVVTGYNTVEDPNSVGAAITASNEYACSYTNGWQNGQAVSITNTPNNPQVLTIDTYGQNGGELITYDEYKTATDKEFTRGSNGKQKESATGRMDNGVNAYTITDGNTSDVNSRIWKYVDDNGVTQYLEAEYNEADKNYYIMVAVPVRKWIDVLGNSRKISMTINVLKYGEDADGNTVNINPGFGMWGNEAGSLGTGHPSYSLDNRYDHEDILAIFNNKGGYYQVDSAYNYYPMQVDLTIGDATVYNDADGTTESWFDLLRSPYTLENTIIAGNTKYGYGDEMVGYLYVSALRFAVPIGCEFTVKNMKGDGNSAGLNQYSTTGAIVSAYDGGTGTQPNINLTDLATSTLIDNGGYAIGQLEAQAGIDTKGTTDTADDTYYYDVMDNGTYGENGIKGTQEAAAAAYGPYLDTSYYTIYDLLDTEKLNSSGLNSHQKARQGLEEQKVYGKAYINTTSTQFPILPYPAKTVTYSSENNLVSSQITTLTDTYGFSYTSSGSNWNRAFGYTYGKGTQIMVYAVVYFQEEDQYWGLTGALEKDGTPWLGFVLLSQNNVWYYTTSDSATNFSDYGYLYDGNLTLDKSDVDYYQYASKAVFDKSVSDGGAGGGDVFRSTIQSALKNEWYYSNFMGNFTNFSSAVDDDTDVVYNSDGSVKTAYAQGTPDNKWDDIVASTGTYLRADDVYTSNLVGQYANMWTQNGTNCSDAIKDSKVVSENVTDMKITMNTTVADAEKHNWSIGMSRVFQKPISLKANKYSASYDYPAFYFDFSALNEDGTKSSNVFALTVRVNNKSYLYYLDTAGELQNKYQVAGDGNGNSVWGYYDLQPLMDTFKNADGTYPEIQIVGFNMYFWRSASTRDTDTTTNDAEITIRRMEIWQVVENWYDEIKPAQTRTDDGASVIPDSMNIINEAFFNVNDETKDGEFTLKPTTDENGDRVSYTVTDTLKTTSAESYKKAMSNKGWTAKVRTDTDGNGLILDDGTDDILLSTEGYWKENIYEYQPSLGHLRVWVPAGTEASVVFSSDRSFNTDNYRYLYYSYSVRDFETGISAEEPGNKHGITVAIKSQQNTSDEAYLEQNGSWVYYPEGIPYTDTEGHDNRDFTTNMCAALDLSTLDGIDSVNQFVFYLNNTKTTPATGEAPVYSEYYINYVYLSNIPPAGTVAEELQETQVQYYYLMDNTGDRYSARFPTLDNPTGQVSGTNSDNDRVNPIVVERGKLIADGKYLNGDLLSGYGDAANRVYNDQVGSDGYYEKTYSTDALKNIWFYTGESDDLNDITDYYTYVDRGRKNVNYYANNTATIVNGKVTGGTADVVEAATIDADGNGNVYDMLWSYGRWFTGKGESGLNMMYVGDPDYPQMGDIINGVSGNLTRRYATENYVLLRSGIEPLKYLTYYDTKGGQILYTDSKDINNSSEAFENGVMANENNYYITETVLFSYFKKPITNNVLVEPQKYGYKFMGWHTETDLGQNGFTETLESVNLDHLYGYTKKTEPGINYFYAVWKPLYELDASENPKGLTADTQYKAKFHLDGTKTEAGTHKVSDSTVWFNRVSEYENGFSITLPQQLQIRTAQGIKPLKGWQVGTLNKDGTYTVADDATIYYPGTTLTVTADCMFFPVTGNNTDNEVTHTITVTGAKLMLSTGIDGVYNDPKNMHINYEINETTGVATYYNVPRNLVMVAIADEPDTTKGRWEVPINTNTSQSATGSASGAVVGKGETYKFSVYGEMSLKYVVPETATDIINEDPNGMLVSTMPTSYVMQKVDTAGNVTGGREMVFVSQFDDSAIVEAGGTVVAHGTLYTKVGKNYDAIKADLDANMRLQEKALAEGETLQDNYGLLDTSVTAAQLSQGSYAAASTYVRHIKATTCNKSNQYYFMVTENKGNATTYYTRAYVIYELNGVNYVAYSDIVTNASLKAATLVAA